MNETLIASTTLPAKESPGLYQRLVLDALGKMTAGCLRIELPGDTMHTIGDRKSVV